MKENSQQRLLQLQLLLQLLLLLLLLLQLQLQLLHNSNTCNIPRHLQVQLMRSTSMHLWVQVVTFLIHVFTLDVTTNCVVFTHASHRIVSVHD